MGTRNPYHESDRPKANMEIRPARMYPASFCFLSPVNQKNHLRPALTSASAAFLQTILASATLLAAESPPDQPVPCKEKEWIYKHRYLSSLVLQATRRPRLDVYFLGDSITEWWPLMGKDVWQEEFGAMRVFNCGVAGDTTQNILFRITQGEFEHTSPKVVVLLAGINNLGLSATLKPEELAKGIQRIIAVLHAKSPASKILLLSIFPSGEPGDPVRDRIRATNKLIQPLADGKVVFFLDLYDKFLDAKGVMPYDVSPDGTHLYSKGYRIWADAMRPVLKELLETPDPNE
jgi:lysophospholipase L1-like esterase